MKFGTLVCITVVLYISMFQYVDGGKRVSEKKLANWGDKSKNKDKDNVTLGTVDIKKNSQIMEHGNELGNLLAVIQYVITDTLNNKEFRQFIIKRFLHNYVSQTSNYMDKIKNLKKKMNSKGAKKEKKSDKAI